MPKKIYWSVLLERTPPRIGALSAIRLAHQAGRDGYEFIATPYGRTDMVRNSLAERFLELSSDPHDTLIMLDNDHDHPMTTLARLAAHDLPVVGALAFRRGEPYDACAFVRLDDGKLHSMAQWDKDRVYRVDVIGHAAIAIQRRVFQHLLAEGHQKPWWRYVYTDGTLALPSEDMYFCALCEKTGVAQFVDTGLVAPHLTDGYVDESSWRAYMRDHPGLMGRTDGKSAPIPITDSAAPVGQEA